MAKHTSKATKKFEKNHLKDIIDKRKEFAKIKQRQQIKVKKKARNASDRAEEPKDEKSAVTPRAGGRDGGRNKQQVDALNEMTVDEFFARGIEIPEPKTKPKILAKIKETSVVNGKRKRDEDLNCGSSGSESAGSVADDAVVSDEEPGSEQERKDDLDTFKGDLSALAEKDPEFYKYLKENDAELLDFTEDGDIAKLDLLSDEEGSNKKRKTIKGVKAEQDEEAEVTLGMVDKWKTAMSKEHSLRAMRQAVLAFRAAAHVNSEDGKEYKYSISNPDVYHRLLVVALEYVPIVLNHHLPAKELPSGKVRIATDSKKYRAITPLLKSHLTSINHLLENLSDASTLKLTLTSIVPLLPYLLSFKKVLKSLITTTVGIWSLPSSTSTTLVTAFLLMRRLFVLSDPSLRESILKTTYQGLIKNSRTTNTHTLPSINLLKNSAAELWSLDPAIGYTTAFTYIRQLAIHLRASITQPTKDSYKQIYNWQYTHSLDFWSRVLSTTCSTTSNPALRNPASSPFHPLIYPLVQITLGALRLIPTPAYFPLRFHLTRSLLRVSSTTNTYIPLAPSLLEVLNSPDLSKPPKASTLAPLHFPTILRAPQQYLRTRVYQDGLGEQIAELLAEFFACWAKHIAFPELVIPPLMMLKRWLKAASSHPSRPNANSASRAAGKGNKNNKLNSSIALLVQKLDANAKWVEERRRAVRFAPSDREGVEGFLREVQWESTPLGAFVVGARGRREERERLVERGRVGEKEEEVMDEGGVSEEEQSD